MLRILALLFATFLAPDAQITWLSVAPVAERTEVVVRVLGDVSVNDFMLNDGQLIVDITGVTGTARTDVPVNRGGVNRVRVEQFTEKVARVTIELTGQQAYELKREEGALRIRLSTAVGAFVPVSTPVRPARPQAEAQPPAAPELKAAAPKATTKQPVKQDPQERVIIISWENEPLSRVLGTLSMVSGRSILAATSLADKAITAEFLPPGLSWRRALEAILDKEGLVMREREDGTIIVEDATTAAQRAMTATVVTDKIELRYVTADSVKDAFQSVLTPETGQVQVLKGTNILLITDVPEGVQRALAIKSEIDIPAIQVEIGATVAFVDRTTLEAMGVTYDLKDSRGTQLRGLADNFLDANGDGVFDPNEATADNVILLGGNSIAALGNATNRIPSPAIQLATSLVLGRHTLISFLEALQTVSLSDIQAKPWVRGHNHVRARIHVGERTPLRVLDASGGAGSEARANVRFEETGVILDVTPHVTGDQIRLEMHAERSNIGAAPSDLGITFQRQSADVTVTVGDGETAVIGGMTIIEKTKVRSGIPLLMDLPVIGSLFRTDTERENKRDLLVLVTPRIVRTQ